MMTYNRAILGTEISKNYSFELMFLITVYDCTYVAKSGS